MTESLVRQDLLIALGKIGVSEILNKSLTGIEKESLRVSPDGSLSQSRHPQSLGSALKHPWITTDYSEAMLELITPPMKGIPQTLDFLRDLHLYVYAKLRQQKESLWATSMPCVLAGETNIPIAEYGTSNHGRMKSLYRVGLGHRYGKVMQVISGVHFNFSFEESLWPLFADAIGESFTGQDFIDEHMMHMVRNIQRFGWLIPYLFGASPAVCRSFFGEHQPSDLDSFDEGTYFLPYATSLRMSDIGYQNQKEEIVGVKANYDSLESYIDSLANAISTPAEPWKEIGLRDQNGEYLQLNTNILQIENEYYSTVRPKQPLQNMEMPTVALKQRGIRYVELRSLDVNAFDPLGINESQLRFLQTFFLFCLLHESPVISPCERHEIDKNLLITSRNGRDSDCMLQRNEKETPLREWGMALLDAMRPVAALADSEDEGLFTAALEKQVDRMLDAELTPSARMLAEMREYSESFYAFAHAKSHEHYLSFEEQKLDEARAAAFEQETADSLRRQLELEMAKQENFDHFLEAYFATGLVSSA
ncbi:glutamate--cysteine ligase [Solemya elarraichensis gill symbiont]|uniref:Glutamate--cysteine ligase n=1 Tax=Solemya elarraichensis gill symbiont TaxID=1918949 RepID=A0A1T2L993_9GAMM|nr:glutamate--cysteine ligase [Solemya elarraichensis gill symbiont]OOZ41604.1 glutamate--cysteine ligase [Solemya elarraichensis gill symbiont]